MLDVLLAIVQNIQFDTYIEPFLGGGALAFALSPEKAVLADKNAELMNLYGVVRDSLPELEILLKKHEIKNSSAYFYKLRELDRTDTYDNLSPITKAARFLYMNKTAYNGLYRVNKKGQCNMPYGKYVNPVIDNHEELVAVSSYLNKDGINIYCKDYSHILDMATKNDFVYLDPPYCPVSKSAAFTAYNNDGFGLEEQKRLKACCDNLQQKGIPFLQSNADSPFIRDLYKDYTMIPVTARRSINSCGDKRTGAKEVLIISEKSKNSVFKLGLLSK